MHPIRILLLLLVLSVQCIAQDDNTEEEEESTEVSPTAYKGFHAGFYAGAFFPNNYSASLYNGYGVDAAGSRNNFINSVLIQRMILNGMDSTNSGALHFPSQYSDQIAQALGVNHDIWYFNESDMPNDLKYNVAFMFGLDLQYGLSATDGIIFNLNFSKINVKGTFTINTRDKKLNPSLGDSIHYFAISGQEQRFMLQLGFCRLLGPPAKFNFLIEGGLLMNSAKYLNNYANINNLKLDLTPFTYNQGYEDNYLPTQYNAIGYGAFAGIGFNLNINPKYLIQVIYNPSFEKINTGAAPTANLQQSVGARVYYNFD
jgi:hypothetical protein